MAHLVTLAHRVSSVHARYADIHSSIFRLSFSRLKAHLRKEGESVHCGYEKELRLLAEELVQVKTIMNSDEKLEPDSTLGRDLAADLKTYIDALSGTIGRLARICHHLCLDSKDVESYSESRSRADRVAYDESIQHHRRLGARLNAVFRQL